jgi:hypothetical protein
VYIYSYGMGYKKWYKYVGFRTVTGRWRHLVTRRDNQKNTHVKFNSKDHLNKTIPWKLRRVVVSIDNVLLSTGLIESDTQNRIQKTQL